ncbi:DUF748 domain-containing protein [Paraburkholderia sp. J76]|uniref:DUF748 domain-containing protein n=1 Tax=Paraburkholderia sp. J76 TaxID=2805439 RepID=UPI002ABE5859|nr:DUF748 domain-containing protein [Paraburkholderia sp. J76]
MASLNKASLNSSLQSVRAVAHAPRTRRILIGVVVFLVVFGLLGFFAAPPLIRHVAEQQLSKQLDRPVTIGRIALNPYTLRLEADRVHIGERGGNGDFFDVSRAVVQASWSSVFRAAPIVEELRLDSPRATIVRLDAQHFNFSDLIEKFSTPSKPNSKPAQFSVSNIRIENGQITFDDRLLNEKHVIDRWSLGIPFIATLPSKTDIFVQPMLRARIDGASTLAIDGKTKPFSATRESEVELRLTDLDVPKLLTYAPTKLPVTVRSGRLSTNLKLDFVMSAEKPTLRVTGTTDLNDFDSTDNANAPFFGARSLHVAAASLEPFSNVYRFDDIRLDAPTLWVARDKQGVLSVEKLMGAPAANESKGEAASHAAPASGASGASGAQSAQAPEPAKPAPLDLSIRQFALTNGTVHVRDNLPSRPVNLDLTQLSTTLANFSSTAKAGAPFTFAAMANDGGTAKASGTFSMAARNAEANIALQSLSLPRAQPYIDNLSGAQILDGKLNLTSTLKADWAQQPAVVQVGQSTLGLESLKLAARGANSSAAAPAIALAQGTVQVSGIDLNARKAQIASVDLTGLVVNAGRQKDGKIDLAQLASTHQAAPERTAIHAAQKSVQEGPAWRYTIDAFTLNNGTINFTDSATQRPVKLAVTPLDLKIQQISDDLRHPLPIDLKATVNRKGTLALSGKINPTPLTAQLKIDANRLDVAAFEPYFGNQLNAVIASALLNMNGQLAVEQGKALKANYRGDAALVDVRMLDKATSGPFAGWRSLALTNLKANYDDARGTDVDASRVTFAGFYGRVLLDAQGKLNLKDVVAHQTGAAQPLTQDTSAGKNGGREPVPLTPQAASAPVQTASAPAPASAPATVVAAQPPKHPVRLHFGELVLQDGRVNYTDNFIKPNYTADLVQIHGTVGAFGTDSTTPAPVDVAAKLAANGPLSIKGTVNPLIDKPSLDLTASAHDIELTNLTPYSAKYAGYPITKGKLNVDLHYALANDQLTANNHIFIDQLTFGDHIDNDTATRLPVRLAISLLKNRKGEIDVNIPVSGSLSNPEFSLGGLIWKAVLNLIAKAVTAPFTLLANAFGGGGEDLGYVEFAAGTATLTDADQKKLDTIVKALDDKPSIKIDLIGRVDPAVDTPALREQYVDRLVRLQKVKDTVGNGESVDTAQVKVDDKEYEKYLTKVYKDADFKKPRNMVGLTKALPVGDMKQALADHAPVDDATLRDLAQQRAQAVQQYFEGKVDPSRVFIVAPKLDAKGIDDKGATTRVDFGLK